MSPLFEGNMLSLMMTSMRASNRNASGAVVKSPSKELSQFSEPKTPMSSSSGINSWIGALKAGQIGPKSARIVLIPPKSIGKRLSPRLNWQGSIEASMPMPSRSRSTPVSPPELAGLH